MYSAENYTWGLIGYYLGVILLLAAVWRFSQLIPWKHPRQLLLLLIAVILLVPVKAYPELHHLAPAFFVAIFESFTKPEPDSYLRGLIPLIVNFLVALTVYVSVYVYRWWRRNKSPSIEPTENTQGN